MKIISIATLFVLGIFLVLRGLKQNTIFRQMFVGDRDMNIQAMVASYKRYSAIGIIFILLAFPVAASVGFFPNIAIGIAILVVLFCVSIFSLIKSSNLYFKLLKMKKKQ